MKFRRLSVVLSEASVVVFLLLVRIFYPKAIQPVQGVSRRDLN
jgi:hypothetical protein